MLGLGLADPERQRDIVDADTFNLWASASSLPSPGSMRRSTNLLTGMFGEIIMQKLDTACDKNASSFVHSVSDRMGCGNQFVPRRMPQSAGGASGKRANGVG